MPVTFYSIQLLNYFVSPVWCVTFVVLLQHGVTLSQLLFFLLLVLIVYVAIFYQRKV